MKRALLVLLCCLVSCKDQPNGAPADAGPSERDLELRLRKRLTAQHPDATIEAGKEARTLGIRLGDGTSMTIFLDNVVHDCAASPAECDSVLDRYARVASVRSPPLDRAKLGVTVKSHQYLESYRGRGAHVGSRPLVADMDLVLARDLGNEVTAFVDESSLTQLHVSFEDALTEAIARQEARCTQLVLAPVEEGAKLSALADTNPVPCMTVAALWQKLQAERRGDLFVTVPTAAGVLVVRGVDAIADLRALTEQAYAAAAHPVSKTVLRWTAKGWAVHAGADAGGR